MIFCEFETLRNVYTEIIFFCLLYIQEGFVKHAEKKLHKIGMNLKELQVLKILNFFTVPKHCYS